MGARRRSQPRWFVFTCPAVIVLAAVGTLALLGSRPTVAAAGQLAAAGAEETALDRFAGDDVDSPLWWLARAEQQAGLWGNAYQQAYSLAEIAKLLADADQIEAAVAVAQRINDVPALLGARWRIAAAYARAGKLEAADALARLGSEADGRPAPDAYIEINCHIAEALANVGRLEEAEKIAAGLERRPSKWTGKWEPPGNLVSVKARIHAALAAACAKAGRRGAYREHVEKCETLAKSIPGDVNKLWAQMLSSMAKPTDPVGPNPINAIYKGNAVRSVVLARAEAGDYQTARKALELIPAGRHRDSIARSLVEALAHGKALDEARTVADAIGTDDHRDRAYVTLVAAYARAGELTAAKALTTRLGAGDWRALAQMHLAAAVGGSGQTGDVEAVLEATAAEAQLEATRREEWARTRAANPAGIFPPAPPSAPRLRARLYREVARVQAPARSQDELTSWIKTLPGAESRFYAMLGVAEQLLAAR